MDSTYVPQYALGAPTSPQTANQIAEATSRLNAGVLGVDISMVNPEILEQIPKQHFKEIDRLIKLTGARATMHAPIVDLAGFTQQGWQEEARKENENQVKFFVERAHDLDEDGNTPINFHINTMMPGEQWRKLDNDEYKKMDKNVIDELKRRNAFKEILPGQYEIQENIGIVNRETGQINLIRREVKEYPAGPEVWAPERRLKSMNQTTWDEERLRVFEYQRQKAEVGDRFIGIMRELAPYEEANKENVLTSDEKKLKENLEKEKLRLQAHMIELDQHIYSNLNEIFNQLKYVPDNKKEEADKLIKEIREDPNLIKIKRLQDTTFKNRDLTASQIEKYNDEYQKALVDGMRNLQIKLSEAPTPEVWTPSNKLAKEKNVSADKAKETAEKLIGVTWDVGHINFMRKEGYSEEDIKRETEKIAPYVKQVHITDNFGFNDAHLPPGMGNAPIKDQLRILEKAGFKFDKGNVIVEAGAFVAQFKENPHLYALEYFESPLYTYKTMPYCKDVWETEGKYGLGYGPTLPEQHFAMYGGGFSNLPLELGGQVPGDRSRFAGTPNQ